MTWDNTIFCLWKESLRIMREGQCLSPLSGLGETVIKAVYFPFLQFSMSKATFDLLSWYSESGKGVLL